MPWRDTHDPYRIWIAEIILQQTRIEQGEPYFHRFMGRFPDVHTLASANQDEVLKYWEGLGYYSRARNLHAAAKQLVGSFGGIFPNTPETLMTLKGIGPYTSRAIASFAFGYPAGVLDGNVLRIVSRVMGSFSPIDKASTRNEFQLLVDSWAAKVDSRAFNQGMMDLGATRCTPTQPACLVCPLQGVCVAARDGIVHLLPAKSTKLVRKERYFDFYLLTNSAGEIAIRQRSESGFWGGLWELPNTETTEASWKEGKTPDGQEVKMRLKHVFTHFDMHIRVVRSDQTSALGQEPDIQYIDPAKIPIFAFSKAVHKIFDRALPL